MIKYKKVLIIILTCIIIFGANIISLAAENTCTVSLEPDKTQVKKGESVTVLIKVSNIQGDGIAIFNANVNYDSNIFDCRASGSDAGDWTMQGFIENNLSIARADLLANKQNQTIGKLVFTAKQDATLGNKSISLTGVEFSTGETSFYVSDVTKNIEIIENTPQSPSGDAPGGEVPGGSETPGSETPAVGGQDTPAPGSGNTPSAQTPNGVSKSNTSKVGDNSVANKSMPQTGIANVFVISFILIVAVLAVILYKRNKYFNIK